MPKAFTSMKVTIKAVFSLLTNIQQHVPEDQLCIVSKYISEHGKRINYFYRYAPEFDGDTGWRFLSGYENEKYAEDQDNFERCTLNIVCNFDPNVINFLSHPAGTKIERSNKTGRFVKDQSEDIPDIKIYTQGVSFDPEIPISFHVLPEREFWAVFSTFAKDREETLCSDHAKEAFRVGIFETQGAVEFFMLELASGNTERFSVGYDFNYCHHTSSGIYSIEMVGPALLRAIMKAHSSVPDGSKWAHSVVFEIDDLMGDMIVQYNNCYILDRTPSILRDKLGCPVS
ncbi:MAG: DUF2185 domain-containing protein [Planctomycetota bacterium]